MSLFTDGRAKRACLWCGRKYLPYVPDQKYCGPYCRNKAKALEAKSARRVWWRAGRPLLEHEQERQAS
jgi:hypothetical protein